MRTLKEIAADIRETRREMKLRGVRKVSCFNGGLSAEERAFNSRLFNLETERKTVVAWAESSQSS